MRETVNRTRKRERQHGEHLLLADPAAVVREAGVDLPADLDLRVVEHTADMFHLVLPALPEGARDDVQLDVRVAPFCCTCGEIPKCTELLCDGGTCLEW